MKKQDATIMIRDLKVVIPAKTVGMLQYAADDWSRVDIAEKVGLSVRTVEAHFDSVRRSLGKKTFSAALVELYRKKIIK